MAAQKKIDNEMVVKLAAIGCTNKEIASVLDCNEDYLARGYNTELERGREQGKMRLRQKQMEVAMKGNVPMLIFLGKNMLGQSDRNINEQAYETFEVIIGTPTHNNSPSTTSSAAAVLDEPSAT